VLESVVKKKIQVSPLSKEIYSVLEVRYPKKNKNNKNKK
jgi:hypothetical protein